MKTKLLFATCFLTLGFLKAQIITTVAGNGTGAYAGDGGQASVAELYQPYGVAFDGAGNMYIADNENNRIRKVTTAGIITTVAGTGAQGYSGDGGQATAAELYTPTGIALDAAGNLYIVDEDNFVIRKVTTAGIITTVAGNNAGGYSGDGGQATAAEILRPYGMTVDAAGNLYIADTQNNRVRKVNTSGIITTIAGTGTGAYGGDGGQASSADLYSPSGVIFDATGNLYIADTQNNCIRKVNTSGIITTIVGSGTYGYTGDGGQATLAELKSPRAIVLASGNLFIADETNNCVRKVNTSGIISTIAGNGVASFSGDGGQATAAELNIVTGVAFDGSGGNLYITDFGNNRIRMVTNVVSPTGIEQLTRNNEEITIYPNPSNGSFNVTYTGNIDELKVTDMLGQIVYEAKPQTTNTALTLTNAGIYFITLISGTEMSTKKVIVSK